MIYEKDDLDQPEEYRRYIDLLDQAEWTSNARRMPRLYNFDRVGVCCDHSGNGLGSAAVQINSFDRCEACQSFLDGEIATAERQAGWPTIHDTGEDEAA